jgi:virulence factor Mce-like protein
MSPVARRKKQAGRKRGMRPLTAAAITLIPIIAITYYAFAQQIPLVSNPFELHALVTNSVAVRVDSPVRIAGVDVGKVEGVSTGPGNTSEVNFNVDGTGLPIHSDATIKIRDRLFLEGGYYLELDPGSPSAPDLSSGDTIPASRTSYPVQFYNLLSTFDGFTRNSLDQLLNTLNDSLSPTDSQGNVVAHPGAVALKATIPQLTPTLKDTSFISRSLRGTQAGDVEKLLSSASDVTTTLQNNSLQLTGLVNGLSGTAGALAASDGALAQSVSGLDQVLQASPSALTAIDQSLPAVTKLGTTIDPSLKLAPPLIRGLTTAVIDLGAVVAPTERSHLLTSLRTAFVKFPNLLGQLGGVFPTTKAVTDCLSGNVLPILGGTVQDGALTVNQPVWQQFVHALTGVAGAAQNFDGNGHWVRLGPVALGAQTVQSILGNVPGVGQLIGLGLGATATLQGFSPAPVNAGTGLPASAFQPGVACSTQKPPTLTSPGSSHDFETIAARPSSTTGTLAQLEAAIAKQSKAVNGR